MKSRSHHHRLPNSDPPDDWVNGSWTVDCLCGVNFDDGEEMVNCDECGVWVHTRCSRYVKGDDIFVCDKCKIKNNRNESEETEVAQLLVELPTKTVRMESSYVGSNGASRRPPFRLWTEIPIEERAHVQGKPGGDPSMFGGLSGVFTPELWKCSGYVPKKFNFRYREFPCWDDKEGGDGKLDEENENPVDKGAGVLFSLSKERGTAAPAAAAALVGLRGREAEEVAFDRRKVCVKERNKWDGDGSNVRRAENGAKKESSLLRSVMIHASKRKKLESEISNRIARKKARAVEKEVDTKKRGAHISKSVFTTSRDAKHLAFYGDRAQKFHKDEVQSSKNKKPRETAIIEPMSDHNLASSVIVNNHVKDTPADLVVEYHSANAGTMEDKISPRLPEVPECFSKADNAVFSVGNRDKAEKLHIKEEGNGMSASKTNDCLGVSNRDVGYSLVNVVPGIVEVKQNSSDIKMKSERPNIEVKVENMDVSGSLLNVQSSLLGDAKDLGIPSDHVSGTPKLNDTTVKTLHPTDHRVEDLDLITEAASESRVKTAGQLLDDSCLLKSELEGSEGLMALHNSPRVRKHGSGFPEEHVKPGGTVSQRRTCNGKPSTSATSLTPKSSTSNNYKSANAHNSNPFAKPQITHDSNVNVKKDHAIQDGRVEIRDENPRKTVKERPKSVGNTIPKPSNSGRFSHDSLPKKTTAETKENVISVSSKSPSPSNATVPSCSGEPAVQSHHQRATHMSNRSSASGLSQKIEKPNPPNFQAPSKTNQNHVPSVCPPIPSSSPAALSDEELALLLHQELNSSPRVPRVPRMRQAGNLPQLASPSPASMLMKRISNSGGKDHSVVPKRKYREAPRDGFHSIREASAEPKRVDRVLSSQDPKRRDTDYTVEANTKEDNGATATESVKKNASSTLAPTNSGPSSSNEANDSDLPSIRTSPRSTSDDDTGIVGGPVHRTLPGLINDIMSKGKRMTYEELCNAVLPHWHSLRKHNGERYAYTSHSQAVLDCLRNRHEWARLVDRGPKTNSSRKRRKHDAEDSEDNDYINGKSANGLESKSLESQKEDFPKGKRKARKRRRLALQGKGIKDIRKKRKQDRFTDEDFGTSSNSSEESTSSEDEIQGDREQTNGSDDSSSSHEEETV